MNNSTSVSFFTVAVVAALFHFSSPVQVIPTPPAWVIGGPDEICESVSPCTLPSEVFDSVQLSIAWYREDGRLCVTLPFCGPNPQIRQWIAFSRGGPAWLPSATSHDVFVSQGPLYSGGSMAIGITELGAGRIYANGEIVTFMLAPTIQQGTVTVLTEAEVDARIAAAIAAIPGGGMTPAQFQTMLDASSYGAFVDPVTGHTHNRPDLTITRAQSLDGVTIPLPPTGPPQ